MGLINCSICVTDIPKEVFRAASNGKKYLNFTVADRQEKDQYDNTHTIYLNQSKEQREAGEKKHYIGSGKEVVFGNQQAAPAAKAAPQPDPNDDLPF